MNKHALPKPKGLVLAGGRSKRMGHDKGLIQWHGKPQREHLADLLESLGLETYVSCRPDQAAELTGRKLIVDQVSDQGPLGAIYSAFMTDPDAAWLVVACDMPLIDKETILYLLENRNPARMTTAFQAPAFDDESPDPLCAIWEPGIFSLIKKRLGEGQRCARKTLMAAGVHLLEAPQAGRLANVNTPEELHLLKQ